MRTPTCRPLPPMILSDLWRYCTRRHEKARLPESSPNQGFSREEYLISPPNPSIPTIALTGCGTTYESSGKGQEQFRTDGGGADRISTLLRFARGTGTRGAFPLQAVSRDAQLVRRKPLGLSSQILPYLAFFSLPFSISLLILLSNLPVKGRGYYNVMVFLLQQLSISDITTQYHI